MCLENMIPIDIWYYVYDFLDVDTANTLRYVVRLPYNVKYRYREMIEKFLSKQCNHLEPPTLREIAVYFSKLEARPINLKMTFSMVNPTRMEDDIITHIASAEEMAFTCSKICNSLLEWRRQHQYFTDTRYDDSVYDNMFFTYIENLESDEFQHDIRIRVKSWPKLTKYKFFRNQKML